MMNYKVDELKFMNMKKVPIYVSNPRLRGGLHIFQIEDQLNEEEKLQFIDLMKGGIGTYLLTVIQKWEDEKDTLPKDNFGHPKTVSKKAWLKRNDPKKLIDNNYKPGNYHLFGTKFNGLSLICPTTDYGYSMEHTKKGIIHQWFHDLCEELMRGEQKFFQENDPKQIKLTKVREYGEKYHIFFDNLDLNDIIWNHKTDISEDSLDKFIKAYEELEKQINIISSTLNC